MGNVTNEQITEMNDNDFKNIENLKWLPFIGELYNKQDKKILIVGESHYKTNDKLGKLIDTSSEYTRDVLKIWGMHSKNTAAKYDIDATLTKQPMFANLHRALGVDNNNTDYFWNTTAFYNFVQRPMEDGTKNRPTSKDFIEGWKTFFKLLEILKADYCIFVGVTAVNFLNESLPEGIEKIKINYKKIDENQKRSKVARIFKIGNSTCIAIQHTSHHFSNTKWNKFLNENLSEMMNIIKS